MLDVAEPEEGAEQLADPGTIAQARAVLPGSVDCCEARFLRDGCMLTGLTKACGALDDMMNMQCML